MTLRLGVLDRLPYGEAPSTVAAAVLADRREDIKLHSHYLASSTVVPTVGYRHLSELISGLMCCTAL